MQRLEVVIHNDKGEFVSHFYQAGASWTTHGSFIRIESNSGSWLAFYNVAYVVCVRGEGTNAE